MALNVKKNPEAPAEAPANQEIKNTAAAAVEAAAQAPIKNEILGSKSNTIVLVSPLGDPTREDVTPRTVNGKVENITTSTIVGFLFKALEDVVVPECGMGDDARKNPMTYKDINGSKAVKAGETFALTRFETGLLLSRPEYNAHITGEGREFSVVYQKASNAPKSADGSAVSDSGRLPTVSLRGVNTSIKDLPMIDVLTFQREKTTDSKGNPRTMIINRQPVAGYEKFEPLCRSLTRKAGSAGSGENHNTYNKAAQAFLSMVSASKRHSG